MKDIYLFIVLIISIIIIYFTMNELFSYSSYVYGTQLFNNCEQNTEFETPEFQYYGNSYFINKKYLYTIIILPILIYLLTSTSTSIIKLIKLFYDKESVFWKILFTIFILFLIIIPFLHLVLTLKLYDKSNNENEKIYKNTIFSFILITFLIYFLLCYELYTKKDIPLVNNINILTTIFFIVYLIICIISLQDKNMNEDIYKQFFWNFKIENKGLYTDIHEFIKRTGPIFLIFTIIYICLFIYDYKNEKDINKDNYIIPIILFILFIIITLYDLITNSMNFHEIENNIKLLNKEVSEIINYEEDNKNYIETASIIDNYFKTEDYTISKFDKNFFENYTSEKNKNKCSISDDIKTKLTEFNTFISFENINNIVITPKNQDIEEFIDDIIKTMKIQQISENDELSPGDIKSIYESIIKFKYWIDNPQEFYIKNPPFNENTPNNNPIYNIRNTILKNYKELHNIGDDVMDTNNIFFKDSNYYISENKDELKKKIDKFVLTEYVCMYLPFHKGDIDKMIKDYDNYELSLLPRDNLKTAWINYRKAIKKKDNYTPYIFMIIFLFIFFVILLHKLLEIGLTNFGLITILILLIIIVLIGFNIKIIVSK